MLRKHGVVGKFVEFYGPGVPDLSIADRATISNMSPEYGATIGYFPPDTQILEYLKQTGNFSHPLFSFFYESMESNFLSFLSNSGRDAHKIKVIETYFRKQNLFRDYHGEDPVFSSTLELDLGTVQPCLSGPKRPHDRVPLKEMKADFNACLNNKVGFKGYAIAPEKIKDEIEFEYEGEKFKLPHGGVVIAAITSCTNTSNPDVLIAAGLVAKKAVELGLSVKKYVKTSLSPGSG